jgi:hypothetical protein
MREGEARGGLPEGEKWKEREGSYAIVVSQHPMKEISPCLCIFIKNFK